MHRLLIALPLTLVALATDAAAQTMDFDCPTPGTTISFDSGTKVVARGRDGMDCQMDVIGGAPFKLRGLIIANPTPESGDNTAFVAALRPERLWPLEIGKRIEARYAVDKANWTYILTVAKYEKRPGPGGALVDTFLIEMNEQGDNGFRSLSRWWIAPAEKYMIHFDASNSNGVSNRAVVTSIAR